MDRCPVTMVLGSLPGETRRPMHWAGGAASAKPGGAGDAAHDGGQGYWLADQVCVLAVGLARHHVAGDLLKMRRLARWPNQGPRVVTENQTLPLQTLTPPTWPAHDGGQRHGAGDWVCVLALGLALHQVVGDLLEEQAPGALARLGFLGW